MLRGFVTEARLSAAGTIIQDGSSYKFLAATYEFADLEAHGFRSAAAARQVVRAHLAILDAKRNATG
jgi:hypothetical protein